MKIQHILLSTVVVFGLVGCSSSQEKAADAQAEYTEEKTQTLKEYKECVKTSGSDEAKMKQCEALLKAVEALEGGK